MDREPITAFSIGPYRVERLLGTGGMGEVFEAHDERLGRKVALKMIRTGEIDPERAQARFLREARAAAQLSHPSIVQIYDILETPSGPCLVLELVAGTPLRKCMETRGLSLAETVGLAREIAGALEAAHRGGIIHRDLKAGNVIVTPEGRAKVLDFGIAKHVGRSEAFDQELTVAGQVIGTPAAMSPEQAQGLEVTPLSDLFSLGSLLYEMLTGKAPFLAADRGSTMERVHRFEPPKLREVRPEIPEDLADLVHQLMSKDPADRLASAAEVQRELREIEQRIGEEPSTAARVIRPDAPTEIDGASARIDGGGEIGTGLATEERRQITILCCDLVDENSRSLEPERLYPALNAFRALVRETCHRFDGQIADDQGHRIELRFGYPMAHEDDARRAVHSALELSRAVADIETEDGALRLRCGVHTGPAVLVATSLGSRELMLGNTLEIAGDLRGAAQPGQVLISSKAQRLIEGYFSTQRVDVPTSQDDLAVYQVTKNDQSETSESAPAGPLLGRKNEIEQLRAHWGRAEAGHGQILLISGEPGIGKSRLVQHLRQIVKVGGSRVHVAGSSPYHRGTPLFAVGDLFQRSFGIDREDPETALDQLSSLAARSRLDPETVVPLLARAISIAVDDRFQTEDTSPRSLRSRTRDALVTLLLNLADQEPLVLVFEDLHWCDPTSLELIENLMEQVDGSPVLLALTYRSDFELPWSHLGRVSQIHLDRLEPEHSRQLIASIEGGSNLPSDLVDRVVVSSDGIPLFVEELTRHFLELLSTPSSDPRALQASVPVSLRDALAGRLDRLGSAKEIAQVASAFGRRFSSDELAAATGTTPELLQLQLQRLTGSGLVLRSRAGKGPSYLFRHALIQEAAYDSLLPHQRRALHGRIVRGLESFAEQGREARPEDLARHLEGAELHQRAGEAWLEAGRQAAARSAHREAVDHLRGGLRMVPKITASAVRDRYELELLTRLGGSLSAISNYSVPEVAEIHERARVLCEKVGSAGELTGILIGLWTFHLNRGDREKTEEITATLELEVSPSQHPGVATHVSALRGYLDFYLGNFGSAIEHLNPQADLFRPRERSPRFESAIDPAVVAELYRGWTRWFLGQPDSAWKTMTAVADGTTGYNQGQALSAITLLAQCDRDPDRAEAMAERAIRMAREQGYDAWLAIGQIGLGWALAVRDQKASGLEKIETALELFRSLRTGIQFGFYLAILADACRALGQVDRGLDAVEEGLRYARDHLDGFCCSELLRLRGELLDLSDADDRTGESRIESFREAARTASAQKAPILELRAWWALGRAIDGAERELALDRLSRCCESIEEDTENAEVVAARQLLAARHPAVPT